MRRRQMYSNHYPKTSKQNKRGVFDKKILGQKAKYHPETAIFIKGSKCNLQFDKDGYE